MKNEKYLEMIDESLLTTKPIKLVNSTPQNIFKTNEPLLLSHLSYLFLKLPEDLLISAIIHKPNDVINSKYNYETEVGIFKCRIYNSTEIYSVLYLTNRNLSASSFTSAIVYGYNLFSKLFVKCKIRFISKDPIYIVYESEHSPVVVVSFKDILSRYGISNEKLYNSRISKIYTNTIKKQMGLENNDEEKNVS